MSRFSVRVFAAGVLLALGPLAASGPRAQARKVPAVPEGVVFETGIKYTNPDHQPLRLNLAMPKKSDGPFPAILCIHGGGFRAGRRESYDGQCIRLAERGYVAVT